MWESGSWAAEDTMKGEKSIFFTFIARFAFDGSTLKLKFIANSNSSYRISHRRRRRCRARAFTCKSTMGRRVWAKKRISCIDRRGDVMVLDCCLLISYQRVRLVFGFVKVFLYTENHYSMIVRAVERKLPERLKTKPETFSSLLLVSCRHLLSLFVRLTIFTIFSSLLAALLDDDVACIAPSFQPISQQSSIS